LYSNKLKEKTKMFDHRYLTVLADTEESKQIHYQLRYQVYCLEKGFEDTSKFEDGMEVDHYDDDAIHFLVKDRISDTWLATARLVIADAESLPMGTVADFDLDPIDRKERVAEFTRLSILPTFRHQARKPRGSQPSGEPEILLGVFRAVMGYCGEIGVKSVLFLCRRSIWRVLGRLGVEMQQIGPPCQHRGVRFPYLINLETMFSQIIAYSSETHRFFNKPSSYLRYSEIDPEHAGLLQSTGRGARVLAA
jgi:N-acyl amino acid synthase of PEP-CTERM/exosortase system